MSLAKNKSSVFRGLDYYPFGMEKPGRTFTNSDYRYGYNGKEKDNEMSNEASVSKLMSCYIYISPNANSVLKKNNINEIDILNHLSNEIRTRRIMTIDANRVFPGSKDSFYIGLKKKEKLELYFLS